MYYPYFRGKQYDLITIRENAELMAKNGVIPIIEPVKQALAGLKRTIEEVNKAGGQLVLIVNPSNGDHSQDSTSVDDLLLETFKQNSNINAGILLTEVMDIEVIKDLVDKHKGSRPVVFIHAGFSNAKLLNECISSAGLTCEHIFIEGRCTKLYRKHFDGSRRILLRDGFTKRANKNHPPVESFSDLHVIYEDEGMDGFGDFLIVGDEYMESGGPAYSVAIHLTFIDPTKDDEMFIHHFKSIRFDTPTDPAGKFAEALSKLVEEVGKPNSFLLKSGAVKELLELQKRGHFPGLGYVKKLSMQHHIETLVDYLNARK